jgi:hypothetical protein
MAAFEGTRANDFGFWRAIEARLAEALPRRTAIKAAAPTEERIETVP